VKSGRLVDAEAAKKAVFDLSCQDRDSWANWPSRVTPLIAAELGVDPVNLESGGGFVKACQRAARRASPASATYRKLRILRA
jgi:hypothetical protein